MGRHLTVATVMEANRISSDTPFIELVEVDIKNELGVIVETIRFCRNNENVTFMGNQYVAAEFTIDIRQKVGEETTVSMSTFDPTGVLRSRMEEFGGGVGFPVRFHVVNAGRFDEEPEISESFEIISASSQGYNVSLQLGAENPLRMRFPLGLQYRDRCRFQYRDGRCKYAGPLGSCDFTYSGANGCVAHNNAENYGGYRGLNQ